RPQHHPQQHDYRQPGLHGSLPGESYGTALEHTPKAAAGNGRAFLGRGGAFIGFSSRPRYAAPGAAYPHAIRLGTPVAAGGGPRPLVEIALRRASSSCRGPGRAGGLLLRTLADEEDGVAAFGGAELGGPLPVGIDAELELPPLGGVDPRDRLFAVEQQVDVPG